jgi:hypothetical protein
MNCFVEELNERGPFAKITVQKVRNDNFGNRKFEHVDEEELIELGLDAGRSTSGKYRTYAASIPSNASKNSIRICSSASKSDSG